MTDHDERAAGDEQDGPHDANPPTKNALRAGFGYLVFLSLVLSGLAAWFVLTRTA